MGQAFSIWHKIYISMYAYTYIWQMKSETFGWQSMAMENGLNMFARLTSLSVCAHAQHMNV